MSTFLLVIGLILFIGLIVVHEFGHFIVARRNGVDVEEFSIFFPPRLYRKQTKAGWLFSVGSVPAGGFVKLKGEHDSDTEPGSFGAASTWVKTKIMAAGVFFNLLTALVLLTILALIGMPKFIDNQYTVKRDTQLVSSRVLISYVESGSPADKAGLKPNDQLIDIGLPDYSPVSISRANKLPTITKDFAGKSVKVYYVRDGETRTTDATLLSSQVVNASRNTDNPKGYLGIVPNDFVVQRSTWSAPIVAVGLSAQMTALTFQGLGHALAGLGSTIAGLVTGNHVARAHGQATASEQVGGPVAIYAILKGGSALGYQYMLFIIAVISLTLAIMNILPIPALDGGRLWLTLGSRAAKRPVSAAVEEWINLAGFFVIGILFILLIVNDVNHYF